MVRQGRQMRWVAVAGAATLALGVLAPAWATTRREAEPGPIHAGNTYGWNPWIWEDQWHDVKGGPIHGLDPWVPEIEDGGTGQVTAGDPPPLNEQMVFDSSNPNQPRNYSKPSSGSMTAIREADGVPYARWEIRSRPRANFSGSVGYSPYTFSMNLIPADPQLRGCGEPTISFGQFQYGDTSMHISVTNAGQQWGMDIPMFTGPLDYDNWHVFAIELRPKQIAWFLDAKVVAKLRVPEAIPGIPMTLQFTMADVDDDPLAPGDQSLMNRTRWSFDWIRHWTLRNPNKFRLRAPAPIAETAPVCS